MNDMMSRGTRRGFRGFVDFGGLNGKEKVQVRRGMVAQDGFDKLGEVDLKAPIEISFIDQFGQEECVYFTFFIIFFRFFLPSSILFLIELVSMGAVCSRNSLRRCVRKSSIRIEGSGWRT